MTTKIDGRLAQARRLYHHMVHGGTIELRDVAYLVEALERAQVEIEALHEHMRIMEGLEILKGSLKAVHCADSDE